MSGPLLLSCEEISKAFGSRPLFEGLSLGLFEGDRVGLIGPNGSGKSTLLKILAGLETPDNGTRSVRRQVSVGYVAQDPSFRRGGHRRERDRRRPRRRCPPGGGPDRNDAGPRRFRGPRAGRAHAVGGMEEASGHRARAGARAGHPPHGRAHQPPRRGRHPLAGRRAADPSPRLRRGEPRPLLPGERHRAHARAEPRLRGRPPGSGGELQRLPREARRGAAQRSGLPGVAGQHRPPRGRVAPPQGARAHDQGPGAREGSASQDRRAVGGTLAQRGVPGVGGHRAGRVRPAHAAPPGRARPGQGARRQDDRARPRPRADAGDEARSPGAERQREDDAPQDAGGDAGPGHGRDRPGRQPEGRRVRAGPRHPRSRPEPQARARSRR